MTTGAHIKTGWTPKALLIDRRNQFLTSLIQGSFATVLRHLAVPRRPVLYMRGLGVHFLLA